METPVTKREREEVASQANKRARKDVHAAAARVTDEVAHMMDVDLFRELFFEDEDFQDEELCEFEVDDDVKRAFETCIETNAMRLPTDGLPDEIGDIANKFVEAVVEAAQDGAMDDAVKEMEKENLGAIGYKALAMRFFNLCEKDLIEQSCE
jgi:hypothetical protein